MTLCNLGLQKVMKSSFLWRGLLFACLLGVLSLELVKFFPWGRVSAPASVAPEALEENLCSSKGYKRCPTGLPHRDGHPASFSAGNSTLSAALGILRAGTTIRRLA